jgi:hypothetical protein
MRFDAVGLRHSTADRCGFADTAGVRAMGHFSRGGLAIGALRAEPASRYVDEGHKCVFCGNSAILSRLLDVSTHFAACNLVAVDYGESYFSVTCRRSWQKANDRLRCELRPAEQIRKSRQHQSRPATECCQPLLLARTLYQKPKFLLLDEATSGLDTEREQAVNQAVKNLGITTLLIAHRDSTVDMAGNGMVLGG